MSHFLFSNFPSWPEQEFQDNPKILGGRATNSESPKEDYLRFLAGFTFATIFLYDDSPSVHMRFVLVLLL